MQSLTHTVKSRAASGRRNVAPAAARRPVDSLQRALGNEAVGHLAKAGALGPGPQPQLRPEQVAATIVEKTINAPGQPLTPAIRAEMEARFGQDFGNVRIHIGGDAAASARAINARAYTVGSNIAFASGQYAPDAAPGRQLLAHELAHVVQQDRGGPEPNLSSSSALEAAAAQAAIAATQGEGAIHVGGASGVGVAREAGDSEEAARRRLAAALDLTGKYAHEVKFKTVAEYVASAATNGTVHEDGTVTAYIYDTRPPVTVAPAVPIKAAPKVTPKPKPKPKPEPAPDIDAGRLREIAESRLPRLIYPKGVTRVFGGLQMIGGGFEIAAGVLTVETGVGPLLLGAHGIDTLQTGARTLWSGEQEKSVLFYAGSGTVFLVSDDAKLAQAGGLFFDMAGGVAAGAYSLHITPSPTITLSAEAELDLELAQLSRPGTPQFTALFDESQALPKSTATVPLQTNPLAPRQLSLFGEDVLPLASNLEVAAEQGRTAAAATRGASVAENFVPVEKGSELIVPRQLSLYDIEPALRPSALKGTAKVAEWNKLMEFLYKFEPAAGQTYEMNGVLYTYDAERRLVRVVADKNMIGARWPGIYKKYPQQIPGYDYGHVGGVKDFGTNDLLTQIHGGFPQEAVFNQTGAWKVAEDAAGVATFSLQRQGLAFEKIAEVRNFVNGIPSEWRIYVKSGDRIVFDSQWLKAPMPP
jgi:hypothetical protein